jgi:hypothetical protein
MIDAKGVIAARQRLALANLGYSKSLPTAAVTARMNMFSIGSHNGARRRGIQRFWLGRDGMPNGYRVVSR